MCTNQDLHIKGTGTTATVTNAEAMSRIWQSWVPRRFSSTKVSFDNIAEFHQDKSRPDQTLCFYSGGIDSTYTILKRVMSGKSQDLLTVLGMDYKAHDKTRFSDLIEKTSAFAKYASSTRILVEADVYAIYKPFKLNDKYHHVTHIFALAGVGFLHSRDYKSIVIAADRRLDQQFARGYYGSNSATNFLFDDGLTRLVTDSDNVTRTEKMPSLKQSPVSLQALTFCSDKRSRPLNCGVCSKCMRTKLMFVASTGAIPPLFQSDLIPNEWYKCFEYHYPIELSNLLDIIISAKYYGHTDALPFFTANEEHVLAFCRSGEAGIIAAMKEIGRIFRDLWVHS
ncbi:MAG: hypothetical protein BWY57_03172 [Betaproteobacteria bacterium ADurb.Bin341]|nr:MAG: hypothetical protein BWY57_03172 [Betaproteobacteria bacterium ADurb.Bin341]